MTQKERIENATTKQAVVFIWIYSWVIVRNLGRAINKAVHKLPWLFIVVTVVISFIVSFIFISKARAERDSYNQKLVHATQQLDSYMAHTETLNQSKYEEIQTYNSDDPACYRSNYRRLRIYLFHG